MQWDILVLLFLLFKRIPDRGIATNRIRHHHAMYSGFTKPIHLSNQSVDGDTMPDSINYRTGSKHESLAFEKRVLHLSFYIPLSPNYPGA
jgi:hypothetical protein